MATITLNLSAEQTARVQAALEAILDSEEVTLADAKDYLIKHLQRLVRTHERREHEKAARLADSLLDVT